MLLSNSPAPRLSVVPPSSVALRRLLCHGAERRQQRARGLAMRQPDAAWTRRPLRVSVCVVPWQFGVYGALQVFPLNSVTPTSSYSCLQKFKPFSLLLLRTGHVTSCRVWRQAADETRA